MYDLEPEEMIEDYIENLRRLELGDIIDPILKEYVEEMIRDFYDMDIEGQIPYIDNIHGRISADDVPLPFRRGFQEFFYLVEESKRYVPIDWDVIGMSQIGHSWINNARIVKVITTDIWVDFKKMLNMFGKDSSFFIRDEYKQELIKHYHDNYPPHDINIIDHIISMIPLEELVGIQYILQILGICIKLIIQDKYEQLNGSAKMFRYDSDDDRAEWDFYVEQWFDFLY